MAREWYKKMTLAVMAIEPRRAIFTTHGSMAAATLLLESSMASVAVVVVGRRRINVGSRTVVTINGHMPYGDCRAW